MPRSEAKRIKPSRERCRISAARPPESWPSRYSSRTISSRSRRLLATDAADFCQRVFIRGDNALDGAELKQQPTRQCRTNSWQALKDIEISVCLALNHDAAIDAVVTDTETVHPYIEVAARSREIE